MSINNNNNNDVNFKITNWLKFNSNQLQVQYDFKSYIVYGGTQES